MVTDTHFGARNDSLAFNDYFFQFYEQIFFPYLKENDITTVVHLGDVMDRRKFVSYRLAKDFSVTFIDQFTGIDFQPYITTINLYQNGDYDTPVIQATLPRPIKKSDKINMRFKIKLDI